MQFNVENLFLYLEKWDQKQDVKKLNEDQWQKLTDASVSNKSLVKTARLAEAIFDVDPDIVMLNEVGGLESLENFNKHFLNSAYHCHLIEGNSKRGIDVGYLVHTRLKLQVLLNSHRNRSINLVYPHEQNDAHRKSHLFSRDVSEIRLFKDGQTEPFLVCLLTHLKSKLDPDNIDPAGRIRRKAELLTMLQIYNEIKAEVPNAGIVVAGDFNGQAVGEKIEPEFLDISTKTDLINTLDLKNLPAEKKFTQFQFPKYGAAFGLQLDYIWVSKNLEPNILLDEVYVYRFKNAEGSELPLPTNSEQVYQMPSDHYPVVTTLLFLGS